MMADDSSLDNVIPLFYGGYRKEVKEMDEQVKRNWLLNFKVNSAERTMARSLAKRAACTPSELLRTLLRREAERQGLLAATEIEDER
jgi:hypothetical protein